MENDTIPAGWYDDGHGTTRWWDGTRWTEHVAATATANEQAGPDPAPQHPPAPTAPASPARKRRLGLILAAAGVVVVGMVAGAVLLIPAAMNAIPNSAPAPTAPSPSPSAAADGDVEPTRATLSEADRAAAVATVQSYQDAWLEADCDAYLASTTEEWQQFQELTDCETFYGAAKGWLQSVEGWGMEILEVKQIGDSVAVSLSETYTSEWDHEGNPLDAPTAFDDRWEYIVIEEDGVWLIDNGFLE